MLLISLILVILGAKKILFLGLTVFVCSLLSTIIQVLQIKKVMDYSNNPNLLSFKKMTKSDNWKEEITDYVDETIKKEKDKK